MTPDGRAQSADRPSPSVKGTGTSVLSTGGLDGFESAHRAQKRRVLSALLEAESVEAAPVLADDETVPCEAYEVLLYELQNVLLPELAAAGFVEFDREVERVTRGPAFDDVRPLLEEGRAGDPELEARSRTALWSGADPE